MNIIPSEPLCNPDATIPDLPALRERLLLTRARLLERIANDWPADRRFPDTAWCRLLGDVQACLQAVDSVLAEADP